MDNQNRAYIVLDQFEGIQSDYIRNIVSGSGTGPKSGKGKLYRHPEQSYMFSDRILAIQKGREEKAEELAVWCENTYAMIAAMMETVDADGARKSLLYCLGDKGVNVIAQGSFHAETINFMSDNLAVVEDVVSSGAGNEVDLEQILVWDPEVIIFAPDSCYDAVADAPQWQSISAVASRNYYETPYGPYGWLSSPPAVQRYLGMLWLGKLLYPEYAEYDLQEEVTAYYKLFYGCDLTDEMYRGLMENAMPR